MERKPYTRKAPKQECSKCKTIFINLLHHQKKNPNCDQPKEKIKFDHKKYGTEYFTRKVRESNQRKRERNIQIMLNDPNYQSINKVKLVMEE